MLGRCGSQRFGALQAIVEGVSPKVLTTRLRRMEADGLIWRRYKTTMPPSVTYGPTESGTALHAALKALEPLAGRWFPPLDA